MFFLYAPSTSDTRLPKVPALEPWVATYLQYEMSLTLLLLVGSLFIVLLTVVSLCLRCRLFREAIAQFNHSSSVKQDPLTRDDDRLQSTWQQGCHAQLFTVEQ